GDVVAQPCDDRRANLVACCVRLASRRRISARVSVGTHHPAAGAGGSATDSLRRRHCSLQGLVRALPGHALTLFIVCCLLVLRYLFASCDTSFSRLADRSQLSRRSLLARYVQSHVSTQLDASNTHTTQCRAP